jgi:adenosine deaminase
MVSECDSALAYRRLCTCRKRFRRYRHVKNIPQESDKQGTLEDMLNCFEFFFPLVYDNFSLLEELAYDFVERQSEQNVIYTEVRYSPHLLGKDPVQAMEAITRGLRRGCQAFPVTVNQILCAICFFPDWSEDVVELADQHRNDFPCAVVGIDIAAGEAHFDKTSPLWKGHYDMCQRAKELGLNITIHAGETPDSAQNVQTAIEEYGARRIGHAYKIVKRKDIIDLVRDKNIHIESCLTSSVETGGWEKTEWRLHPANTEFRDLSLSLSSDDPAVFNTSLTWQYRIALKKMRWEKSDIMGMLDHAADAAFLNEQGKEELRRKIKEWSGGQNYAFQDRVHYD